MHSTVSHDCTILSVCSQCTLHTDVIGAYLWLSNVHLNRLFSVNLPQVAEWSWDEILLLPQHLFAALLLLLIAIINIIITLIYTYILCCCDGCDGRASILCNSFFFPCRQRIWRTGRIIHSQQYCNFCIFCDMQLWAVGILLLFTSYLYNENAKLSLKTAFFLSHINKSNLNWQKIIANSQTRKVWDSMCTLRIPTSRQWLDLRGNPFQVSLTCIFL